MFDLHHENRIATLTLRHGKVNAMDLEFLETLRRQLDGLANDSNVSVVILTTAGTTFSAGVDLKRLVAERLEYNDSFLPAIRQLFRAAFQFPKPLVGAIRGHALAGGCVLATSRFLGNNNKTFIISFPRRIHLAPAAHGLIAGARR